MSKRKTTKEEAERIDRNTDKIFGLTPEITGNKGDIYAPSHAPNTNDELDRILEPLKRGAGIAQRNEAKAKIEAYVTAKQTEARQDEARLWDYHSRMAETNEGSNHFLSDRIAELKGKEKVLNKINEPRPTVVQVHDFPAKTNGFKPWEHGYKDWQSVPEELFECTRCGVEWGAAIRSGVLECGLKGKEKNG